MMPPKRSAVPTMSRADNVRHIWAEFEAWHTEQLILLDERIAKALQEIDQNRKPLVGKKKNKGKDKEKADAEHENKKEAARKELEKTFDGDKVRDEWQTRLQRAGLVDDDWGVMTANEQRKVEKILGLDLDFTEGDVTIIEAGPPPPAATQRTTPPSLHTSPLSNSSRTEAISDNYAFVDPASFHVPEPVEASPFDNWLEVMQRQRVKSDDELSLDASTTSSWGGGGEVPAYLAWSSEISRSSAQSSQTSLSGSPERAAKLLPEQSHSNLVSSAVNRLALFGDSHLTRPVDSARLDHMPGGFPSMKTFDNFSGDTHTSRGPPPAKPSKSKSGHRYIGPDFVSDEEKADAAEFMERKLEIRIAIIREFHQEAAEAGIRLAKALSNDFQNGTSSRERTVRLTQDHEDEMLALRESKERKRKELVEKERQDRLTKFQQRKRKQTQTQTQMQMHQQMQKQFSAAPQPTVPAQHASPDDFPFDQNILTEKFLRELSRGPDTGSESQPAVSETPTIRSQLNRIRLPNISDWLIGDGSTAAASAGASTDSGTDTPTPTMQSSGWKVKETATPIPALSDAPPFKRLPSSLAQSVSADSTFVTSDVEPTSSTKSPKAGVSSTPKKSETKPARTNNKNKKEKTQAAVTQPEEVSSSKTKNDQMAQKPTKVDQLRPSPKHSPPLPSKTSSSLSSPPPPVPLSTRPDIPATPAPPMALYNINAPAPLMESIYRMPTLSESQTLVQPQPQPLTHAQPQPQAHHYLPPAAVDNHQRWVPPAPAAVDKRPHASRTTTEPPSQIKKTNTSQNPIFHPVESFRRERRMSDPVSPSPRSFDFPNGKVPAKVSDAPTGILKKSTGTSVTTKATGSKSSAKVKKVTIEDVNDEEDPVVETLPSDSRHIMEPKPVAAPHMFSQIFEFVEDDKAPKEKGKERVPPAASRPPPQPQTLAVQVRRQESDSSTSSSSSSSSASHAASKSNQMWIPSQASIAEAAKPKSSQPLSASTSSRGPVHFDDQSEKHVRWGGATAFKQKQEESGDSFLAGLDQLMKAVGQEEKGKENGQKARPRAVEAGWSAAGKSASGNLFWDPNAKNTHRKPVATS